VGAVSQTIKFEGGRSGVIAKKIFWVRRLMDCVLAWFGDLGIHPILRSLKFGGN
jgi:hypothetical protein